MADRLFVMPVQVRKVLTKHIVFTIALSFAFVMSACVPKETTLPSTSASAATPGYAGFTGALTAQTVSGTKVKLTWSDATDGAVVAYNIYDATFTFAPKLIKTVTAPADNVTLTGLTAGNYYRLRVRAADVKNKEDGNINDVPAITYAGATAAVVQGSTSAYLQYADASNADSVNIYCNQNGLSASDVLVSTVRNVNLTQTLLTGLVAGQQYNCRAALVMSGFVDNNTQYVTFTPLGTASNLVFTTQPGSATAGQLLAPQPVVTIQDVNGNTVSAGPDATAVITLAISTNSPTNGTVRGTVSATAHAGVATFAGINIQEAGLKILNASKGDSSALPFGSPSLNTDSDPFTISPDVVSPTQSLIAAAPAGPLVANGTAAYTVSMKLLDQYNNPISGISPRFASSNSSDILTQPSHPTDATGVAQGAISTTVVGGILNNGIRGLTISSPSGLTAVSTTAVFIPGPATQLLFASQPQTSPAGAGGMTSDVVVTIVDANLNLVASTDATAMATVDVALSAAPGGGVLLGTTEVTAINGTATFTGLGVDKIGTNYKMKALASAFPTLVQPNSFPFNITSASPTKIAFSAGVTTLVSSTTGATSSVCGTYTIQLQDGGSNASNATTNMTLNLSSTQTVGGAAGSVLYYNSSNCSGTPVTSVAVTTGHNTATVSVRDPAAETVTLSVSSTGLSAGTYQTKVSPAQFVLSGGPISALSGQCSTPFTLTTQGANAVTGPVPADTVFNFSYLNSGATSSAVAYSDSACTTSLGASPTNVTVLQGTSSAKIYFKDPTAEGPVTVAFSAQNNMISATTSPSNQAVSFLGSQISLTSPNLPVVAGGACVGPFAVKVQDAAGNTVTTSSNTLNIAGQTANTKFYTSASCASAVTSFAVVNGVANLYLADSVVETLNISVTDPTAAPLKMAASAAVPIKTSPYKLAWTTPSATTVSTTTGPLKDSNPDSTVCLPLTVATQYSTSANIAPLADVTISLTGGGVWSATGANFYSDNMCANYITSVVLPAGTASTTVYFQGLSPAVFSLTAVDAAGVIATSSAITETVIADKSWIGARVGGPTVTNNFSISFTTGLGVGGGRTDGPLGTSGIHFDATKQYLFVVDFNGNRIFKYDYLNNKYIGWIGGFFTNGGNANYAPITGGASGCLSVTNNQQETPGWCTGGTASAYQPQTFGNFYNPIAVTDDGYNLYVANYNGASITMYNMATGAYEGWLGSLYSTTSVSVVGGPTSFGPATAASSSSPSGALLSNSCGGSTPTGTTTPGFCTGGNNDNSSATNAYRGNGQMINPRTILWANNRLYVGTNAGINMYDGTPGSPTQGAFLGWIGWIDPSYVPTSCMNGTPSANAQTPGWCVGGRPTLKTPSTSGGLYTPTGLYADVANDWLYIVDSNRISRYHLTSGQFDSLRLTTGMVSGQAIVGDGTNMYVADWSRLLLTDSTASSQVGWLGKISTPPTAPASCTGKYPYDNTPGWCANGVSLSGVDEKSLNTATGIDLDGQGNLITGSRNWPAVKKWNASTGVYVGEMVLESTSPKTWTATREYASNGGFDDLSLNVPMGSAVDKVNKILYVVEQGTSRVKKISTVTGKTLGWIGGITSIPTGGDATCTNLGVSAMAASPGWCLGASANPHFLWDNGINLMAQATPGTLYNPSGLTIDSTYLYVTDVTRMRVDRFYLATGVYAGWIGWINSQPIGGDTGCTSAASGFTPGWCIGGNSTSSALDGGMNFPAGITNQGGFLYVSDVRNYRVNKYLASTGAFQGWVGRMGTNTASCATAVRSSTTYTKGWCKGSSAANSSSAAIAVNNGDPGGGFAWNTNGSTQYESMDSDSTYFYAAHDWNNRIDRFWLAAGTVAGVTHVAGEWAGSLNVQFTLPLPSSSTWTTTPGAWGDIYWNNPTYIFPSGIHIDATAGKLYYISDGNAVVMRNLSDGSFVGWQGGIVTGNPPSVCTPSGPVAGFTPGWCQGGGAQGGYTYGQFGWSALYLSGDDSYVYVSDTQTHRVTRIPKRVN